MSGLPTQVRLRERALAELGGYSGRCVLLVADPALAGTELLGTVLGLLGDRATVLEVDAIPTPASVGLGVARYLTVNPDVVVALGGRATLDAAKAVHHFARQAGCVAPGGLIAVPTVSGTGAEVRACAVLADGDELVALAAPGMAPRLAILDPYVTAGAPARDTHEAALAALELAVGAHAAPGADGVSDAAAAEAVRLVLAALRRCLEAGDDLQARTALHSASALAGAAADHVGLEPAAGMTPRRPRDDELEALLGLRGGLTEAAVIRSS